MAPPISEAPKVSLYEATARSSLIVSQNCDQERSVVRTTSAARGISTIRLRYTSVYPIVTPNPGKTLRCFRTIAIGISTIPINARLFRAPVLSLRQREFVLAARSLGEGHGAIILREILPNTASLMIVQGTISLAEAILIASGLSFLGLGPQPPIPEWGAMIASSRAHLTSAPHVVLVPGIALVVVILALNELGDALRDYVDPRVRSAR